MAHMIGKTDQMAYAVGGGVPWHGIGNPVRDDMKPREMLKAAGLDWKVEVREFPIMDDVEGFESHRMLVRVPKRASQKARVLDIVGPRFQPVQNDQVLDFFAKYVKAGKMTMETAGSLQDGRFVWALARTSNDFCLPGGDEVRGYLLLVSPHKRGFAFTGKFTPTRVVCWNTMSYALSEKGLTGEYRMRHDRAFDKVVVREIEETLGLSKKHMAGYQEQAEFLVSKRFSEAQTVDFLARVFEPDLFETLSSLSLPLPASFDDIVEMDKIAAQGTGRSATVVPLLGGKAPLRRIVKKMVGFDATAANDDGEWNPGKEMRSANGTAWGALNVVTFALDHFLGNSDDNRMFNATIGRNVAVKQRALDIAIEMAKAA